ncbi:MAG: AraC family transcriptional regulator [Myxococcales bacterium]|nr:AraC family transcriptional regulator [Myxococcales bacterium]
MRRPATTQDHHERILRVLGQLSRRLDEPVDVSDLARVACISPFHFHRVFRAVVGESVMEHVRRLKLERAAHRLKFSDQPVFEVAASAGYESHEAFTRAFAALFGESPMSFRRRHRSVDAPAAPSGVHWSPDSDLSAFRAAPTQALELVAIEHEPIRALFVRHVGSYLDATPAWNRLLEHCATHGIAPTRPFGLVHDDPDVVPVERLRYDACVVVDESVSGEADVGVTTVAGGRFVSLTHKGPYETLPEVYGRIGRAFLEADLGELGPGPAVEWYLDDLATPPEDCRTEIWLRVEPTTEERS